jgi:hypothetical protein
VSDHAAARLDDEPLLSPRGREVALWVCVAIAAVLVLGTAVTRVQATATLGLCTALLCLVAWRRALLAWPTLVGLVLVVILFIPIRRYTLAGGLPFALEPYRLLIAVVIPLWLGALLIDPKTRWRSTGLELPSAVFALAVLLSLATNLGRVSLLSGEVLKLVTFFSSFFAVMYFISSVVDSRQALDRLIQLLVLGGAVVALFALYEWRSGVNVFNSLERVIPLIDFRPEMLPPTPARGDRPRVYASGQHAIALGAALVMLLPLAVYLWRRSGKYLWMGCGALLVMGALSTGSRTAVVMLFVSLVMFFIMKREATVRLLPWLLPMFIVVQVAMPGTLGTFKSAFFPKQGLVQDELAGEGTGTGRLQDVGPSLQEWGRKPFFGIGFGTRLPSEHDGKTNARILDDQWLSSLLEVGALGIFALVWLFVRAVRRLKFRAKHDDTDYGWLLTALATSITAYAIGMLTYDAFSFIQVTLLMFVCLGLGAAALRLAPENDPPAPAATPEPVPAARPVTV